MSEEKKTIAEMVKSIGKDETILAEMIRLGYWPEEGTMPDDPADELRRRSQLRQELQKLRSELTRKEDTEKELKKIRKQRLQESKGKRLENKKRKEREKKERTEQWQKRQEREITYLGEEVSHGLNNRENDLEKLKKNGLSPFENDEDLAKKIGISVKELRFLCFNRKVSQVSHYSRFSLPKKSGGLRQISAPKTSLKTVQYWLLSEVLNKIAVSDHCHGFCPERSILSNAQPHIGAKTLINVDLENFFPTFTYKRVKGLFKSLGYSEKTATIFALIATEPQQEEIEIDNERWYITLKERNLPQGAPSSPALTNIICRSLDKRLQRLAEKFSLTYTRYADDLSFSTKDDIDSKQVGQFMRQLNYIIAQEGLKINKSKTRISRPGSRKEVTGIVVNEKASIPRQKLKAFRATLHKIEKHGLKSATWGNPNVDLLLSIEGYAHFIAMVDPAKGKIFREQIDRIIDKESWQTPPSPSYSTQERKLLIEERPETIEKRRLEAEQKATEEAQKEQEKQEAKERDQKKREQKKQQKKKKSEQKEEGIGCCSILFWGLIIYWIYRIFS